MVEIACVSVIMGEDAEEIKESPEDSHGDFLMMFEGCHEFIKDSSSDE